MVLGFYYGCGCDGPTNCDVTKANWKLAMLFYVLNFVGDLVDGWAARKFNQSSKYGAVLDMVTDRVSTAGLVGLLTLLYPKESFKFIMLTVLDISSHWFHVVASAAAQVHHKEMQSNVFLKWYYGIYPLFAYCCVSQEFYYLSRWALKFDPSLSFAGVELQWLCTYVFVPGCAFKQVVNVAQWWNAAENLAKGDAKAAKTKA